MENTRVGPFLILKRLGTNRRQRVYRARQVEQDRDVAVKFISLPPNVEWPSAIAKIELEVNELKKLNHPNLVKVYGAGVHEDKIFFAMELVDGESLGSLLARRGKLAPDLVVEYGRQIAEVLNYLGSKELIHSKLTPDKILITPDHKVKIADLRLNRSKRRRWDSSQLRELDIAAYLAPEQFSEGAEAKSDFYSLGVILYEMLTGKLPYDLDNIGRMAKFKMNAAPPSVAAEVMSCPIWLDKIISQMLQPDPRKRPHSAKAIALAFEEMKKLDASQKSTAAQVVGSFNALNAGVDKREARELLNKPKKNNKSRETPIFQTIPFLIGSFLLISALLIYGFWPEGFEKRVERYEAMVQSANPEKWSDARIGLKEIRERSTDNKMIERATQLYDIARRKILVHRAETGVSNRLQSENFQAFAKAFNFEQNGNDAEAVAAYQQLIDSISSNDDENYIAIEARERLTKLQNKIVLPIDVTELSELIETLANGETTSQIQLNNDALGRIIIKHAGDPNFVDMVVRAKEILEANRVRLAESKADSE